MLKTIFRLTAFLILLLMYACGKTCYCDSSQLTLNYVNFTEEELDTIEMRRFTKGSQFRTALDTVLITDAVATYSRTVDTVTIRGNSDRFSFRSTYDYELYLPSVNRKYNIDSIYEIQDLVEGGRDLQCNCTNRIPVYDLDDSTVSTDPVNPRIFIYK